MRATLALIAFMATPAAAQTVAPLAEARLRYEHVTQEGLPDEANAVIARVRAGVQASEGRWSALAEMQGNLAIVGDYYDGLAGAKVAYQASWARQSNWHRNPNDYVADYWLADVAVDLNGPRIGAGFEVLGADTGTALTSFQTPLSSVFKLQGWGDKFIATPPDGIRDLYASLGWGWKQLGALKAVGLSAVYHRFNSDRLVRHYGDEIDLLAQAKLGRTTASVRYAAYNADRLFTDTSKFWLQLDWTL